MYKRWVKTPQIEIRDNKDIVSTSYESMRSSQKNYMSVTNSYEDNDNYVRIHIIDEN